MLKGATVKQMAIGDDYKLLVGFCLLNGASLIAGGPGVLFLCVEYI